MKNPPRLASLLAAVGILAAAADAVAAVPVDSLLPAQTVGFVSFADPADFRQRFDQTDLGRLAGDPSMKPFADQIRGQLSTRFGNLQRRIGIQLDDLRGIASGELALALVAQPEGPAAGVLSVDTAGNADARDALIEKIETRLEDEGAKRSTTEVGDAEIVVYTLPAADGNPERVACWFIADDQFVISSSVAVATELRGAVDQPPAESLSAAESYRYCLDRVQERARGASPDLRWFIDPFGYADAIRGIAEHEGRLDSDTDESNLLREQGFDAIRGVGGHLYVAIDEQHNFVHHTAVYAPADPEATTPDKYRLAMRMIDLPNRTGMDVEGWVPRMIASYTTVNIDLLNAYDNIASLFDAIAGYEDAFKTMIDRFEKDPFGPKIKFRQQIIMCLGSRLTVINDYLLPISPQSERFMIAIEVKPNMVDTLRDAIGKYVESDGYKKIKIEGQDAWEFQPAGDETLTSGYDEGSLLPGIDPQPEDDDAEEEEERLLIRSAVAVTPTYLLIASDVELLRQAFRQQQVATESLKDSFDYTDVMAALNTYGTKQRSSWSFYRIDERLRPGYELLRQGRMPESETFLGRMLNELLTSDDEEDTRILRAQRVEADQLPSFELARRYFGPAGQTVRTDEDGWLVSGVLLAK